MARSQITVTVLGTTATSATFRFGETSAVEYVVRKMGDPGFSRDAVGLREFQADRYRVPVTTATHPELLVTVEGLEPITSYVIYYSLASFPSPETFTTTLFTITPERTFVVGVMQNAASVTIDHRGIGKTHYGLSLASASAPATVADMRALTSYDTIIGDARRALVGLQNLESATEYKLYVLITNDDKSILWSAVAGSAAFTTLLPNNLDTRLTTLEAHGHPNLSENTHGHADLAAQSDLDAHGHTDLAMQTHEHTDLSENTHGHTDLAMQMHTHTHTHTEVPTHTHEGDDDGDNGGGGGAAGSITGLPNGTSRLAFVPNPTHDTFTLRGMDNYARIEIYDAGGQLVHMQTRGLSIALTGYPAGTYIARVRTQQGTYTRQLVKK